MESRRIRTKDAAVYLGIAKSTLEKDRISGKLSFPFVKAGSSIIYDTRLLDEWLATRAVRLTSEAEILPKSPRRGSGA